MGSKNANRKYKCPFCDKRFTRDKLVSHIEKYHDEMIPEDFTPLRYVFNYVNKKPLDYHGICTECKSPTDWDENKGRYNRQCNNPKCKEAFIKRFENNMEHKFGYTRVSSTSEGLEKMLANRRISGKYKFQDGSIKTYTGSYELKALQFMDQVMNIKSEDLSAPGPVLTYKYNNQDHYYITDFYYIPYNLIIEVKDGGKRPNTRNMPEYRAKQIAKEEYIIKHTEYNYIRLTDNDLSQLLAVFADLKMQLVDNSNDRVVHVNEATEETYYPIIETSLKSTIDKDFKAKGKKYLKDFKRIKLSDNKIDQYKKSTKILKHIDTNDNGYLYIDGSNPVAVVSVDKKRRNDGHIWIRAIEVLPEYQGYSLGKQLLDIAVKELKGDALAVAINNEVAKKMYDNYGFKTSKESEDDVKAGRKSVYFMYLSNTLQESMNALMSGYIPGFRDTGSVYIVNYLQNNVFGGEPEQGIAVSNSITLNDLIVRDKEGKLKKVNKDYLSGSTYDIYQTEMSIEEFSNKIYPYVGEFVESGFLYETIFGKKMYSYDQINCESSAHHISNFEDLIQVYTKLIENYVLGIPDKSNMIISNEFSGDTYNTYIDLKNGEYLYENKIDPGIYIRSNTFIDESSIELKLLESITIGGMI